MNEIFEKNNKFKAILWDLFISVSFILYIHLIEHIFYDLQKSIELGNKQYVKNMNTML